LDVKNGGGVEAENKVFQAINDLKDGTGAGIIFLDRGTDGTEMGKVQNLFAEQTSTQGVEYVNRLLQYDLVNIGVNTQDVSSDPGKTAFAVREDNIASSEIATEYLVKNASEISLALELTLELNKKMIKDTDTRTFRMDKGLFMEGVDAKNTLGDWVKFAKEVDFEIDMRLESGVAPDSSVSRQKALDNMQIISQMFPGTPVQKKMAIKFMEESGIRLEDKDFEMQQAPEAQQGQPSPQQASQPLLPTQP
jgi:hypothetical protein